MVEALRADLLRECPDLVDEAYRRVLAQTRQYGNPWGMPRSARGKWAKGLKLKDAQKEKTDVLLFAGCTMSLNPELAERAKKAAAVLQAAGVDFGILGGSEPCCGSVQKRIGDTDLAAEMIANNSKLLNSLGCTTIVTLCAGCCNMLKTEYAKTDEKLAPKVYHLVEYLSRLIKDKKIAFTKEQTYDGGLSRSLPPGTASGRFQPAARYTQGAAGDNACRKTGNAGEHHLLRRRRRHAPV